jgi:MinD-like ATPase involved in chromosome partitioning or flagellar assembly
VTALRLVTVPGDPEREADLAPRLAAAGADLLLRCMDRIELMGALRGGGIDAVVAVGAPAWLDAQAADEIGRAGVRLVGVVSDPLEADHLASLGATLLPADASVAEVVDRCERGDAIPAPLPVSPAPVPTGRLIAVWGPKGAPGRTSLAIELAAALAADEPSTLLVDADPYGGDVLQTLGIVEEVPGVLWAARLAARRDLDSAQLALSLRRAGRGPVVLPGLPRPQLWVEVGEFAWRNVLEVCLDAFRNVVCDVGFSLEREEPFPTGSGPGRNRMTLETLSAADHVVAVCRGDANGIKTFLWSLEELQDIIDPDRIAVVANKVRPGAEREVGELLKRHTGRRPLAYIPDRPHDFRHALTEGDSVHALLPGSDVCTQMRALVAAIGGRPRTRGLLARLGGRT